MRFILFVLFSPAAIAKAAIVMTMIANIQRLNESGSNPIADATRWNNWLFWGYMVLIALVALFTYLVWQSGKNLADAIQGDADARIQEAKSIAAKADERSKKLEHDNIILRSDLNTETGKVAGLQKDAADAKAAQQRVELDLTNAQAKLEAERLTRLQLQRSVLHRMIPQSSEGSKSNFDILKPFKGMRVVFEYSPGTEPEMFSGNLAPFAINSGWDMLDTWWTKPAAPRQIADGVTVEAYVGPNGETDLSSSAADAFAAFLRANGIDGVRRLPAKRGDLPPNAVRVLIGQMPDPFRKIP